MKGNIKKEDMMGHVEDLLYFWQKNMELWKDSLFNKPFTHSRQKYEEWNDVREQLKYGNCLLNEDQLSELQWWIFDEGRPTY